MSKYQPYQSCTCKICRGKGCEAPWTPRREVEAGKTIEARMLRSARRALSSERKNHIRPSHKKLRLLFRQLDALGDYDTQPIVCTGCKM